jgi:uncharacterized protein YjiS (DUF1127 family)
MSNPLVQGCAWTQADILGEYPLIQQDGSSSPTARWMDGVRIWSARCRERRSLRELMEQLDDRLLEDIGISRKQARREAAKPFWQR